MRPAGPTRPQHPGRWRRAGLAFLSCRCRSSPLAARWSTATNRPRAVRDAGLAGPRRLLLIEARRFLLSDPRSALRRPNASERPAGPRPKEVVRKAALARFHSANPIVRATVLRTRGRVANQQPDALQEQQRRVRRQPRGVRLAHHPGDAVVRPCAARQLSAWHSASPPSTRTQTGACLLDCAPQAISKHSGDSCLRAGVLRQPGRWGLRASFIASGRLGRAHRWA